MTNESITLTYYGIELLIHYEYEPAESPVYDVESPVCGPGSEAAVYIYAVYLPSAPSIDIFPLLEEYTITHLEEQIYESL